MHRERKYRSNLDTTISSTMGIKMASSTSNKHSANFRQVQIIIGKEVTLKIYLGRESVQ